MANLAVRVVQLSPGGFRPMNDAYLERARKNITDPRQLVIAIVRRTRQLARGGSRPMVRSNDNNLLDVALLEVAEGLIAVEPGEPGSLPPGE